VVENADVDQRQCVFQSMRDELIGLAGLCHTGWMVVSQDDCRGIAMQRLPHHLAWMHAGAIDGAAEQFVEEDRQYIQPAILMLTPVWLYMGYAYAVIVRKTGSLWGAVLAHAIADVIFMYIYFVNP